MDPKTLTDLLGALGALGAMGTPAAGIFLWLYLGERSERKEFASKLLELTAEGIKAEAEMTTALQLLTAKVAPK